MTDAYDRTVLVIGNKQRFKEYILKRFKSRFSGFLFPACAREILIDRVRYIHVCMPKEARGHDKRTTTYTYVGPHWTQVENVLLECVHYESEGLG